MTAVSAFLYFSITFVIQFHYVTLVKWKSR